jgi:hypothetical protein
MPTIARMPEADLAKLEQGGGLKPRTLAARQRELQFFLDYWQEEGLEHPTELVKTEEGCEKFSKELGRCGSGCLFLNIFVTCFFQILLPIPCQGQGWR